VLFMTSVLIAVVLVAPQPSTALGWELLAVAIVSGAALLILDRRAGHSTDRGVARSVEKFSPNTITAVLIGVAGLTFLLKAGGGLYWLIPAAVASLVGGVVNAWLFLVKVTSESGRTRVTELGDLRAGQSGVRSGSCRPVIGGYVATGYTRVD
jgi:hypothetical protein